MFRDKNQNKTVKNQNQTEPEPDESPSGFTTSNNEKLWEKMFK